MICLRFDNIPLKLIYIEYINTKIKCIFYFTLLISQREVIVTLVFVCVSVSAMVFIVWLMTLWLITL